MIGTDILARSQAIEINGYAFHRCVAWQEYLQMG